MGDDIELSFKNIIRKGKNEMEDEVDSACKRMDRIVDNMKRSEDPDDIIRLLQQEQNNLIQRTLKRIFDDICSEAKRELTSCVSSFCEETEDVLLRFIDDFDARDFVRSIENKVSFDVDNRGLFSVESEDYTSSDDQSTFLEFVESVIAFSLQFYVGAWEKGLDFITNNKENKRELHKVIEKIRSSFDVDEFLNSLMLKKDEVINNVKSSIIDDLLLPMQEQLDVIICNVKDRENAFKEAVDRQKGLEERLSNFIAQYSKVYSC